MQAGMTNPLTMNTTASCTYVDVELPIQSNSIWILLIIGFMWSLMAYCVCKSFSHSQSDRRDTNNGCDEKPQGGEIRASGYHTIQFRSLHL